MWQKGRKGFFLPPDSDLFKGLKTHFSFFPPAFLQPHKKVKFKSLSQEGPPSPLLLSFTLRWRECLIIRVCPFSSVCTLVEMEGGRGKEGKKRLRLRSVTTREYREERRGKNRTGDPLLTLPDTHSDGIAEKQVEISPISHILFH